MKRIFVIFLSLFWLTACGGRAATNTAVPTLAPTAAITVDVDATVAAAVAATATTQAGMDTTIATAVAATAAALPTPLPTDTTEYVAMTEEELAALINTAVNDAIAATESTAVEVNSATSDEAITAAEVETITVYVSGAEEAIALAEEAIAAYYALYGDLALEAVAELAAIEAELAALNENIAAINATLIAINDTLNAGLTLAAETITQLETAAANALITVDGYQAQVDAWQQQVSTAVNARQKTLEMMQPVNVAADLPATLAQVQTYTDVMALAFADGRVSKPEMEMLLQTGVDSIASLQANGGPAMQGLAQSITTLNKQLAGGQFAQAQMGLAGLQAQLPDLAAGAGITLPGGNRPGGGNLPGRP
ncbi:MAG: hypothetical protein IAE79_01170 [Anaerolinea sp.]|nr:hypothetical protein [Anaerolinea sp.]